jgi:putative transposase
MKRSRFTEEIIGVLREQEAGVPTAELSRKHGISSATFYAWKAKYGAMEVSEAKRAEDVRVGEREAEAAFGGCDARQCSKDLLSKKF